MSCVEPLLSCDPLELCVSAPCLLPDHLQSLLPLHLDLVPFFPPISTALESNLGEAVFLPCSPQPISLGEVQRWARNRGSAPHSPAEYSIHSPHIGDGHCSLTTVGNKDARTQSHTLCFSPGKPQFGDKKQRCPPNAQTLPAQPLLLQHCPCPIVPRQAGDKQDSFSQASVLWLLWLRPFQLVCQVKKTPLNKLVIRVFRKKQQCAD